MQPKQTKQANWKKKKTKIHPAQPTWDMSIVCSQLHFISMTVASPTKNNAFQMIWTNEPASVHFFSIARVFCRIQMSAFADRAKATKRRLHFQPQSLVCALKTKWVCFFGTKTVWHVIQKWEYDTQSQWSLTSSWRRCRWHVYECNAPTTNVI